jgi:hypothetical protein
MKLGLTLRVRALLLAATVAPVAFVLGGWITALVVTTRSHADPRDAPV